jgi:hypothetical protein
MWTYEQVLHALITTGDDHELWELYTGYDEDDDG